MWYCESLARYMYNSNIFGALNVESLSNLVKSNKYLAFKENKNKISYPELNYAKYFYLNYLGTLEWDKDRVDNILERVFEEEYEDDDEHLHNFYFEFCECKKWVVELSKACFLTRL